MSLFGEKEFTLDRTVRLAIGLVSIAAVIFVLGYLGDILLPFAVALLLAFMLSPLVSRLQRFTKRRIPAVILALLLVFGVIGIVVGISIPIVSDELQELGILLQGLLSDLELDQEATKYLPADVWATVRQFLEATNLAEILSNQDLLQIVSLAAQRLAPGLSNVLSGAWEIVAFLLGFFLVLLYLIFLLLDFDKFGKSFPSLVHPSLRDRSVALADDFLKAMNGYFRAQLTIVLIDSVLFAVGFTIIGLPLGFLFGILLGVIGIIPYTHFVGILPGFLLVMLHALRNGGGFGSMLLLMLIVFSVVILIQELILVPRFQGKATGLNPVTIILSLSIWGKLLGILGLVIGLPLTYLLLAYYKRFIQRAEAREGNSDPNPSGKDPGAVVAPPPLM